VWGGSKVNDDCAVCGGDGKSCTSTNVAVQAPGLECGTDAATAYLAELKAQYRAALGIPDSVDFDIDLGCGRRRLDKNEPTGGASLARRALAGSTGIQVAMPPTHTPDGRSQPTFQLTFQHDTPTRHSN
jgi:hypothetical protein